MLKEIKPINLSTNQEDFNFQYPTPKICPSCKKGTDAKPLASFSIPCPMYGKNVYTVFILFFCSACETCFIGRYSGYEPKSGYQNELNQTDLIPKGESLTDFSGKIQSLSPEFIKIYHQSEKAEQWGLNEICGMGYRKALEFLVKDFSIYLSPERAEDIKKQPLSRCISQYIPDERIKTLATASAWIGNDETHYIRQHESYGLKALKSFIRAVSTSIDAELSYREAHDLLSKE